MPRPRVSVFLGMSLDGFIARKNNELDFLSIVETNPPEDTGYNAFFASVDVLIMGRKTYDVVMGFANWPYEDKRLIVLTSQSLQAQHGEEFYNGPLSALLDQLDAEGVQHVYLDGGTTVRQGLIAGVVDDLTLSWVPILIGSGISLFDDTISTDIPLQLVSSRAFPSGLVQTVYKVVRV